MTVKDLTENYSEGKISIIDDIEGVEACLCDAGSKILKLVGDYEVKSWKALKAHSTPKIQVNIEFTE